MTATCFSCGTGFHRDDTASRLGTVWACRRCAEHVGAPFPFLEWALDGRTMVRVRQPLTEDSARSLREVVQRKGYQMDPVRIGGESMLELTPRPITP